MEQLADRHKQALSLSQRGYSHSGIANRMDVTPQTAKKYLSEIEELVGIEPLVNLSG